MKIKKLKFPDKLLTVDTGENTSCAYWTGTKYPIVKSFKVIDKKKTHEEKMTELWNNFRKVLWSFSEQINPRFIISKCIIEVPELWGSSAMSLAAAQKGNLFYLNSVASGYGTICSTSNIPFKLIRAKEWKGQLTKRATKEWVFRINEIKYKNEHEVDAVGIGFAYIGWENAFKLSKE